jgi:hypothetical protein
MTRFASLLAIFVSACGVTAADDPTDVDTAARKLAVEECAQRVRCDGPWFARLWQTVAQCEARTALQYKKMLESPNSGLTPAWASRCATALAEDTCAGARPAACELPAGKGSAGASCVSGADCDATTHCAVRPIGTTGQYPLCGTCEPRPPTTPRAKLGEACGGTTYCETGTCREGICRAFVETGGACDATKPCDSNFDMCASGVCTPRQYAKAGEACGKFPGGTVHCGGAAICSDKVELAALGTCVPPVEDGRACDLTVGPGCLPPARCVSGVCSVPDVAVCESTP